MPRKSGSNTSSGKSKKKKRSREISAPETDEKGLPSEMKPDDNVDTETKLKEKNTACNINIRLPPTMLCMRTSVRKTAPVNSPPVPIGSKSMCPTVAALSNPAAFCPPNTGQIPCPIVRSRSCGSETCSPSRRPGQSQSQQFQPPEFQSQQFQPQEFQPPPLQQQGFQSQPFQQEEFQPQDLQPQTCQQFPPQPYQPQQFQPQDLQPQTCQQFPPQPYQPQQFQPQPFQQQGFQPQELQSQAPIIVCSPSQLSFAQRIAAEGTIPPPEVVSSQCRSSSPSCQQTLTRSMPTIPDEMQFQPAPPSGYYGMEGESPGQLAGGQAQWAGSLPNFDGAVSSQEEGHRDTPMPGLGDPSYAGQQPFFQTPTGTHRMPPPAGGPSNFSQWSGSFPICCSSSATSASTVAVPLSRDISHVLTIDIRVRAVQNPPSGLSINKAPNEEGLMNLQTAYSGGSQNRMPVDASHYDPPQRTPSGAMRMPETPPPSAELKHPARIDTNPPGEFNFPASSHEIPSESNQQIQRDQPIPSDQAPCSFKNYTQQSVIPGKNGTCGFQSQGGLRQVVPCPSSQHFSRGQRYVCTSPRICPESQKGASEGQEPYPSSQQPQFSPSQQEMSAPGFQYTPMQFQNIPPCQSAREPRPVSPSRASRSPCPRMSPNTCRLLNDQTGSGWLRPRSGSDPRFQTSDQPISRRSGGSFLSSLIDVLPSISAARASRTNRSIRMEEHSENNQTALNSTQGPRNPDTSKNRTRRSRSESTGSRAQVYPDSQSVQYPPVNSVSEPRRKRRSMS